MEYIYVVPQWFFGFGIAMQLLFAIVTLLVAFYSFKIYRISRQIESIIFGSGFLSISLSYIIKAIASIFVISEIKEGLLGLKIESINGIGSIGVYAHIILYILGLVTISYVTFKIKSKRAYSLLLFTNIAVILMSGDKATAFNLLSSVLIFYISAHYALEYQKSRNPKTLSILIAFIFLFLSGIEYLFSANIYGNYIISQFVELVAYMLILIGLIATLRRK